LPPYGMAAGSKHSATYGVWDPRTVSYGARVPGPLAGQPRSPIVGTRD
jgi:hypothetical protein